MKIYTPLNMKKGKIDVTKILLKCDCGNTVVQFQYGEDSVDPTKSKFGKAIDVDSLIDEVTGGK